MKMRWVLLSFGLWPSLAAAQDWSVETRVSTADVETYTHSGTYVGLNTRDPEGEWLATDVFVIETSDDTTCAKQDSLALDHYYGLDGRYSVNVYADLFRGANGNWDITDPAIFFDRLTDDEDTIAAYEGFDNVTVKVTAWQCLDDVIEMSLSYSGVVDRYEGDGPDTAKIAGRASFQVPLKQPEDF